MKNKFIIASILIVILGGLTAIGYYYRQPSFLFPKNVTPASQNDVKESKTISYKGEAGKTALELLQTNHKAVISGSGEMAFVTSIDGKAADSTKNEFWEMLVNGEASMVGAGSYITKDGDIITWQISKF